MHCVLLLRGAKNRSKEEGLYWKVLIQQGSKNRNMGGGVVLEDLVNQQQEAYMYSSWMMRNSTRHGGVRSACLGNLDLGLRSSALSIQAMRSSIPSGGHQFESRALVPRMRSSIWVLVGAALQLAYMVVLICFSGCSICFKICIDVLFRSEYAHQVVFF
ncbi:uncharacterized protein LOC133895333 [Phragmites australis]|uniref:uncharacterized protein LOC133895333 n=1 Tax=Phragmites australis TaxID=29695 RepID=UPI002D78FC0E|nr:uncharacterized protein LOC133895333 [Phragmites australis]